MILFLCVKFRQNRDCKIKAAKCFYFILFFVKPFLLHETVNLFENGAGLIEPQMGLTNLVEASLLHQQL